MQKKLIVLALASAFAAPAFAATSNVDIYGQFDVSVDYTSGLQQTFTANPLQKDHGYRLSSNASRIGLKGSEDLGGGLAAIWQFEQGVNLDNGASSSAWGSSRNSFLGLKGGWGTLLGGTHDTPYKLSTASLDPFADTAGDYNAIIGSLDGVNTSDLRLGNVLAYITPNFSGFTAAIATSFLKETGLNNTNGAPSAWTGMVNYANGPLYLSAAYETAKHLLPGGLPIASGDVDADLRSWKLGAGYTFGNFTVNGIYEDIKATINTNTGTVLGFVGTGEAKRKAYGLNGVYNMGNIALKAGYYHASKLDTTAGSLNDSAAKMYEVGADYNLSKRTKAYLVYTKVKDDNNASYCAGGSATAGFGTSGVNPVCGDDPSILALGMRHTF
jgi:predicted porin